MRSTLGTRRCPSLLALSGCDFTAIGVGPAIVGERRGQGGDAGGRRLHRVEVSAAIEATVTIGPKPSVRPEPTRTSLPLVKTEVKDGTLVVELLEAGTIGRRRPEKVTIVVPALESIVARGAAKVERDARPERSRSRSRPRGPPRSRSTAWTRSRSRSRRTGPAG